MTEDAIQSSVAAKIAAVTDLAAFGAAIQYSDTLEDQTLQADIDARLSDKGAVIMIGEDEGHDGTGTQGRYSVVQVSFDVFIAESPKVAHTLNGKALRKAVRMAVCAQDKYDIAPICKGWVKATDERGYVLHILTFTVPVKVP